MIINDDTYNAEILSAIFEVGNDVCFAYGDEIISGTILGFFRKEELIEDVIMIRLEDVCGNKVAIPWNDVVNTMCALN